MTPEKKRELDGTWPDSVPIDSQFKKLVEKERQAIQQEENTSADIDERFLRALSCHPEAIVRSINESLSQLLNEIRRLESKPYKWVPSAVRDVLSENNLIWRERHTKSVSIVSEISDIVSKVDPIQVTIPEGYDQKSVLEDALSLKEHLKQGGKLFWLRLLLTHPKLAKSVWYIRSIHIDGSPCSNLERVTSLTDILDVRIKLNELWAIWAGDREKTQRSCSKLFRTLEALTITLGEVLSLKDKVDRCKEALRECNILFDPVWHDERCLQTLVLTCEHILTRINRQEIENEINQMEAPIAYTANRVDCHPLAKELLDAIRSRNVDAFAQACSKIVELDREKASACWVEKTLQDCLWLRKSRGEPFKNLCRWLLE